VLSGDLLGDDGPGFTNRSDNCFHVVSSGAGLTLDGLTVRGGNADGAAPDDFGGGLHVSSGSTVLVDCTFTDNQALRWGGGASCSGSGGDAPTIDGCDFLANAVGGPQATSAGGGGDVVNCTFVGNSVPGGRGGGLYANTATNAASVENAQVHVVPPQYFPDFKFSCIDGLSAALGGTANIAGPPLFADQNGPDNQLGNADDDLNLLLGSPCIDTGDPALPLDLDGTVTDMGALATAQDPVPPVWVDLGFALAGTPGDAVLAGSGDLSANSTVTLSLSNANPFWVVTLVMGGKPVYAWFKLGTFVPFPDVIIPQTTDGSGQASISGNWPPGVPAGFTIYSQYWIQDPGGPIGWAASNGLAATSP